MATNVWRHMIKNSNFKQFTIAKLGGSSYRVDHGAYAPGESHVLPGHAPPFGTFLLSLSQLLVSSRGKPRTVCRAHCFTVHWSRVGGVAWGPCLVEEDNVVPALPVLMLGPRSVDACSSTSAHLHIRWCRRLKKAAFSMLSGTSTCTPGLCSGLYACVKFGQLHAFVPGLGRKRNLRKRQLLSLAWSYPALVFGHLERRSAPPPLQRLISAQIPVLRLVLNLSRPVAQRRRRRHVSSSCESKKVSDSLTTGTWGRVVVPGRC